MASFRGLALEPECQEVAAIQRGPRNNTARPPPLSGLPSTSDGSIFLAHAMSVPGCSRATHGAYFLQEEISSLGQRVRKGGSCRSPTLGPGYHQAGAGRSPVAASEKGGRALALGWMWGGCGVDFASRLNLSPTGSPRGISWAKGSGLLVKTVAALRAGGPHPRRPAAGCPRSQTRDRDQSTQLGREKGRARWIVSSR